MKNIDLNSSTSVKKEWTNPAISILDIKKDTFNGTGNNFEKKPNQGSPTKKP